MIEILVVFIVGMFVGVSGGVLLCSCLLDWGIKTGRITILRNRKLYD